MTIRKVVVVIYTVVISANVYSSSIPLTSSKKKSLINELESYIVEQENIQKNFEKKTFQQNFEIELNSAIPSCDLQDEACQDSLKRQEKQKKRKKINLENKAKGRYPVKIVYINDSNFPYRYRESVPLYKDMSEAEKLEYETTIYAYYLGGDYEQLQPNLSTIRDDYLVLNMYITISELQFYSSDNRIIAIHTPAEIVTESFATE